MTSVADAQECSTTKKCYDTANDGFTEADQTAASCGLSEICTTNTIVPSYCEPGTYTDPAYTSGMASAQCVSCPAEYFCPKYGMVASDFTSTTSYDCPDGYVCIGGAIH